MNLYLLDTSLRSAHILPSRLRVLSRYGTAIAFVSIALGLSLALQASFGNPFWFFFPVAVIASTWLGGKRPGWVAVGLSMLSALYFFTPPYRSWAVDLKALPFLLAFVICQVATNQVVSWRKYAEDDLRNARDQLEIRVRERTAELQAANNAICAQVEEQRRADEALQFTRAELARAARITTVGQLTATVAHELNQPLAAVITNADACVAWLSHQNPDIAEARVAAECTIHGAIRASEVINRIRCMIDKAPPRQLRIQLNELIEEAVDLADFQLNQHEINVSIELSPDLPVIIGDRIQLQQVVLNLMTNGIESMAGLSGESRRLWIRSQIHDRDYVSMSVHDCGVGVSPEAMPKLFEPFFSTRSDGIGIGLSISLSIIESHGGRLWADSVFGEGSVFSFTLPREDRAST